MPELPEGPFANEIKKWNLMVERNREEFRRLNGFEIPDGHIPVAPEVWRMWQDELTKLKA